MLALSSCGGGSGGMPAVDAAPAPVRVGVASLLSSVDVLELPLLQAGDQWYAHVRLKLADDGSVALLDYQPSEARPQEDHAELSPAVALEQLPSATGPFLLTVPRLHMDVEVFQNVRVRIARGAWRYAEPPVPTESLNAADLQGNPALVARTDQVVVLGGTPSTGATAAQTVQYPVQLDERSYRFCVDEQDSAADGLTVIDPQGRTALAIDHAGGCGQVDARSGVYQIRVRLLPTGQGDEPRPVFVQMPQARQQAAAQRLLGAPADDDYYLIEAVSALGDTAFTPAVVYANDLNGFAPSLCIGLPVAATRPEERERRVLDRANFFKFKKDASGRPAEISTPYSCHGSDAPVFTVGEKYPLMGYGWDAFGASALYPGAPAIFSNYAAQGRTFGLRASLPGPGPDGRAERQVEPMDIDLGNDTRSYLAAPLSSSVLQIRYRAKYRLRPAGFAPAAYPAQGEVALFSASDCSGPALLLDQYDLPVLSPGSAGSFNGSLKLGGATQVVLYNAPYMIDWFGSREVSQPGCQRMDKLTASVKVVHNTVDVVVSSKRCENCNLSGLNFSGRDLRGAQLARANLADAQLAGANLRGADLRTTYLHHADLSNANLDEANLCGAQLQARASQTSGDGQSPATLRAAYLRNANLSRANLTGVDLSHASFFSGTTQNACKPSKSCDVYEKLNCASASGATLDGAHFDGAYLAGAGLDGVSARGVSFADAVLVGANLSQAQLGPLSSLVTSFAGAYLQGADFSNADISAAWWTGAVIQQQPSATSGCLMQFKLNASLLGFPGFLSGSSSPSCAAEAKPESTCVEYTYQRPTVLPASAPGLVNALPADSKVASDNCQPPPGGPAPMCGSGFTAKVNRCWSQHN